MNDIRNIITSVNAETGITLVTVKSIPDLLPATGSSGVSKLFDMIAENGVNVDMICLSPSLGGSSDVSFSADDGDITRILSTVGFFGNAYPDIHTNVNSENCKLTFSGEEMKLRKGVAAFVFGAFAAYNIGIKLITTSETKISCLISESDYAAATDMLESVFGIKNI